MSQLVDHLAELTGFRDRDIVDVTLVSALHDLLNPSSVAIYRVVGEGGDERWITRARLGESDAVATADPAWADPESLPRLDQYPARVQAMAGETSIVTMPGALSRSIFPVRTDREVVGVMEIESRVPLRDEDVRMVTSILRIYRNFQGLLDYSERDTLTGLLNRKTFDETFLKTAVQLPAGAARCEGRRASGAGQGYWLGVIDIDHFKSLNDTSAHLIPLDRPRPVRPAGPADPAARAGPVRPTHQPAAR
ncbi:MAG: GGDEF domain-containing protein, partial [Rhizobacter sp.]